MMYDRYLSDRYSLTKYLEEGSQLPARMQLIISNYAIVGKKHFYARLEGYLEGDVLVYIDLSRPTLLIEREGVERFKGEEITSAFTTKEQARQRAREFAAEHGIKVWVKEWYVAGKDKMGEYEDFREVPL